MGSVLGPVRPHGPIVGNEKKIQQLYWGRSRNIVAQMTELMRENQTRWDDHRRPSVLESLSRPHLHNTELCPYVLRRLK